jgi:WD40 repeat protein
MTINFLKEQNPKLYNVYDLLPESANSLIFSPDGTFILICDNDYSIHKICVNSGKMTIFAGIPNEAGFENGPKEQATFNQISSLTFSPDGTFLLVCDCYNHCIRKICMKSGQVSTFTGIRKQSGFQNGTKEQATFRCPKSLTFSPDGTFLLVCDFGNGYIRKICTKSGKVTTPEFEQNGGFAIETVRFSPNGEYILHCVDQNHYIRKLDLKTGQGSIFAGFINQCGSINSSKEQAKFWYPLNVIFSKNGKFILVCDTFNFCIRKICLKTNQVTTFVVLTNEQGSRNGPKEQATFNYPHYQTFSPDGKFLFICDRRTIKYIKIQN